MKQQINFESGRSMVEMLGTLAIIGVLSIGGIMGYSYGMDKYRANQTINDVMLMGVDIVAQLSFDKPPVLDEWGRKTTVGYNFEVVQNPDDEMQYGIQIKGIPSRICKIVGDELKKVVAVYVGGEEHAPNNTGDPCDESDENTMEFYFDPETIVGNECNVDSDCGEENYCDNGWCFKGDKPVGTYEVSKSCSSDDDCGPCRGTCSKGKCEIDYGAKNGQDCSTNTISNGMCYYGECIAKGCTYDENKCEKVGEYCASPSNSCTEAFSGDATGACMAVDFKRIEIDGVPYYVSNYKLSLWDASAACKALGKKIGKTLKMLSQSDLIVEDSTGRRPYIHTQLGTQLNHKFASNSFYVWTQEALENETCRTYVDLSSAEPRCEQCRTSYSFQHAICR